jgi:hypothetical protein
MGRKILFLAVILCLQAGCLTLEFIPAENYPVLRRDNIQEFHLFTRKPDRTIQPLGRMIYRDLYGGTDTQEFKSTVEREGKARGAECGYIARRSFSRQTQFRTNTMDHTNRHGGQTGEIEGNVETIEIVLFQCND